MSIAVVLTDGGAQIALTSAAVDALARIGVTDVTLVRGAQMTGVVLEGWAFDPADADEAFALLSGGPVRTLHPVSHTAVASASIEQDQR